MLFAARRQVRETERVFMAGIVIAERWVETLIEIPDDAVSMAPDLTVLFGALRRQAEGLIRLRSTDVVFQEPRPWPRPDPIPLIGLDKVLPDPVELLGQLLGLGRQLRLDDPDRQRTLREGILRARAQAQFVQQVVRAADISRLSGEDFLARAPQMAETLVQIGQQSQGLDANLDMILADLWALEEAARLAARSPRERSGLQVAWPELADLLPAGIEPGSLVVLTGRPGEGKSAVALQMAFFTASTQGGVLFISLEMTEAALGRRMVAQRGQVEYRRVRAGGLSLEEQLRVAEGTSGPNLLSLISFERLLDRRQERLLELARAYIRRQRTREAPCQLVVVDYLDRIDWAPAGRNESEVKQIARVVDQWKDLAVQEGIVVLLLCQENREGEKTSAGRSGGKTKSLRHIRGSGHIEQTADYVLMLNRIIDKDTGQFSNDLQIHLQKARDDAAGIAKDLYWDGPFLSVRSGRLEADRARMARVQAAFARGGQNGGEREEGGS